MKGLTRVSSSHDLGVCEQYSVLCESGVARDGSTSTHVLYANVLYGMSDRHDARALHVRAFAVEL